MSRLSDQLRRAAMMLPDQAVLLNQAADALDQPPIGYITPQELNMLRCGRDALLSPTKRTKEFKSVWTQGR